MEKNLFIFNFKKLPKSFLITLLLIFIFEISNTFFDNYFYSPHRKRFEGLVIKTKNEIALSKENSSDIIILGDSHSHSAFIPQLIEEKTGLNCFNFSLYGPQRFIGSYLIFKNYLKKHPVKPKYVVIGFEPFSAYQTTKSFIRKSAMINLVHLKKGNVRALAEEFGMIQGIKFVLPSLKNQGHFKEFIKNPFSFDMPSKTIIRKSINQVYEEKGYLPYWKWRKKATKESIRNDYKILFEDYDLNNFIVTPFSNKYLRGILELAKENNVTPIYYNPALPQYVFNKLKTNKYMKQHDDFIISLKKEYPDLIILKAHNILNEYDMFLDIYHIGRRGGELLSEFLAIKINELEGNYRVQKE